MSDPAMSGHALDRDERLCRARELVAAIEAGDADRERLALLGIHTGHESALHAELERIVADLRNTLTGVRASGELAWIVQTELPDAQQRLNQVLELTEVAAHTTLGAIEESLPLLDGVIRALGRLGAPAAPIFDCQTVKSRLGDVLVAQGFQDLTGQMIRRVAALVGELETLLPRHSAGVAPTQALLTHSAHSGGPALPGQDDTVVHDQRDVDELLQQMGV